MIELQDLEARLRALKDDAQTRTASGELPALVAEVVASAHELTATGQHDAAIELFQRMLDFCPDDSALRRASALAHGGKGERALGLTDQLGVPPSSGGMALLEGQFAQAIQLDPTLPDPHWDLAVIQARFVGDFARAAAHLEDARRLEIGRAHV